DAVAGLIDVAEAATAELIEDLVLAEREGGAAAGPDFLHLVLRQPALRGQRGSDLVHRQTRRETALRLGKLLVAEQPAVTQAFEEGLRAHHFLPFGSRLAA